MVTAVAKISLYLSSAPREVYTIQTIKHRFSTDTLNTFNRRMQASELAPSSIIVIREI